MPANEPVRLIFEMAASAAKGKEAMQEAVKLGTTAQYHRVLREQPEARLAAPLLAARKQLKALAKERRRATDELHVEQLDEALAVVAEGTLMWVNEQLGLDQAVGGGEAGGPNQ